MLKNYRLLSVKHSLLHRNPRAFIKNYSAVFAPPPPASETSEAAARK